MTGLFQVNGERIGTSDYGARYEELDDFVKALCYIEGINYDNMPRLTEILRDKMYATYQDGSPVMVDSKYHNNQKNLLSFDVSNRYLSDDKKEQERLAFIEMCEEKGYKCVMRPEWGKWFDFTFFEIKAYKKGTGHFKFKDRDVWARFNQQIARIKGFPLPDIHDSGSVKRNEKTRKAKNKEYAGN